MAEDKKEPKQLELNLDKDAIASPVTFEPEERKEEKIRVLFGFGVAVNARRQLEKTLKGMIYDRKGQMTLFPDDRDLFEKEVYLKVSEAEKIRDDIENLLGPEYTAEIMKDEFRGDRVLKINKKPKDSEPPPPEKAPWEFEVKKKVEVIILFYSLRS